MTGEGKRAARRPGSIPSRSQGSRAAASPSCCQPAAIGSTASPTTLASARSRQAGRFSTTPRQWAVTRAPDGPVPRTRPERPRHTAPGGQPPAARVP